VDITQVYKKGDCTGQSYTKH